MADAAITGEPGDDVRQILTADHARAKMLCADPHAKCTKNFETLTDGDCLFYSAMRRNDPEAAAALRVACLAMVSSKRDVKFADHASSVREIFHINSPAQSERKLEDYDLDEDLGTLMEKKYWAHSGFFYILAAILLRPIWVCSAAGDGALSRITCYDPDDQLEHSKFHVDGCTCSPDNTPVIIQHLTNHFIGVTACTIYGSDGTVAIYEDGKQLRPHPEPSKLSPLVAARVAAETPDCFWPGRPMSGDEWVAAAAAHDRARRAIKNSAATRIQALLRGYMARQRMAAHNPDAAATLPEQKAAAAPSPPAPGPAAPAPPPPAPASTEEEAGKEHEGREGEEEGEEHRARVRAATRIQRIFRGRRARTAVRARPSGNHATPPLQPRHRRVPRPEDQLQSSLLELGLDIGPVHPNAATNTAFFRRYVDDELYVPPGQSLERSLASSHIQTLADSLAQRARVL